MSLQQKISRQKLEEKIGNTYEALIENRTTDGTYYMARTCMDVPDMDGVCWIKNTKEIPIGQFVTCKITDVSEYDLMAEM